MLQEDYSIFFADFGEPAIYQGTELVCIFDRAWQQIQTDTSTAFDSTRPFVTMETSDVASIEYGEVLTIRSQDYAVREKQPDGTGMTVLILEAL